MSTNKRNSSAVSSTKTTSDKRAKVIKEIPLVIGKVYKEIPLLSSNKLSS